MFESDDFDQVLSQFDFPDVTKFNSKKNIIAKPASPTNEIASLPKTKLNIVPEDIPVISTNSSNKSILIDSVTSPKRIKRELIKSHFDHQSKRKFPGPAGLLTGGFEEPRDERICHMELLSQDINFSQNNLRKDLFESPLWKRLLADIKDWNLHDIDTVKAIEQQALAGNLRRKKAQTVTAFVEAVDRSVIDPLIILRDTTGTIKCTLHRDVWSTFSPYIVSEFCAFVLWKPTVLTTGSAFKKHYLIITLSNMVAIYSSGVFKEEKDGKTLPDGYILVYEDDFTVIKAENCSRTIGTNEITNEAQEICANGLFEELNSIFSDEIF